MASNRGPHPHHSPASSPSLPDAQPPSGPKSWLIIGNLNLIIGPLPHGSIHATSEKYGPIKQIKFGSFPVVVGSSAEMAKAFLKIYDVVFAYRPKMAAGKCTGCNFSNMTWSSYGPYFSQARKMCSMEFVALNVVFDIGDSIPWLRFLDLQGNIRRMKAVAKKFDSFWSM